MVKNTFSILHKFEHLGFSIPKVTVLAVCIFSIFFLCLGLVNGVFMRASPSARNSACVSGLKQIAQAIEVYSEMPVNQNLLPPNFSVLFSNVSMDQSYLICPFASGSNRGNFSYCYLPKSKLTNSNHEIWPICFDRTPHPAYSTRRVGRNVLFSDFSIRFVLEKEFQSIFEDCSLSE